MAYPVIVAPWLNVNGMAIFPFILVKAEICKHDATLIRHETIHLRQELELLIILFYVLYLFNYLVNRIKYKTHYDAYLNIAFEREAYAMEHSEQYLSARSFCAWLKFL
jgi:hypothetical protein